MDWITSSAGIVTTIGDQAPQSRLRILCCTSSLSGGGAERVMATLASEWSRAGQSVTLVTFLPPSVTDYAIAPEVVRETLDIGTGSPNWIASALRNIRRVIRLAKLARANRADVMLAFMESPNIASILAGAVAGVPVVVSERVDPRMWTPGLPWRLLRRALYPRAASVVVQTQGVAEGWAHTFLQPSRVVVLPNPVPLPSRTEPLAIKLRTPTVLAAGRLDRQKGFDVLIRAFASAPDISKRYVLEIAGDGPERAALNELAAKCGVDERVRFLGRVSDLGERMATARLFVLSSRFEGFPNVLLEALASGTAAVATDCMSGPRDILGDSGPFALVPVDDVKALADAMRNELANEDADRPLRARRIASAYDASAIAERWVKVLAHASTSSRPANRASM